MIKSVSASVNMNRTIATPNPKMWGVFYEEINHAGDGGLYAELIRNRSFADTRLPKGTVYYGGKVRTKNGHTEDFNISDPLPAWSLQKLPNCVAAMDLTTDNPRNPECAEQLRLTVAKAGDGIRLLNSGYWGISLVDQLYSVCVIIRSEKISSVKIGLCEKNGVVLGSSIINGITGSFVKYSFTLETAKNVRDARFFIEVKQEGTLYLDFVSLFPKFTYKQRESGLRADLMSMLEGIKPGFVRFPGGCVVEGINLQNAIHWKRTIGAMEDRPGHWDLWGYRCTDGLGMYEFCQMSEDLGADIMYVCNCAMSCQARSGELCDEAGVEAWLCDALDAVEYMLGETSTKWGAQRAAAGHEGKFPLRYIEIGNENSGKDYDRLYRKFYSAIRSELDKKYPGHDVTIISNCRVPDAVNEMVDDHFYTVPQYFVSRKNMYKDSDYKIYVGEYACNQEVGYGNLCSAISEAAFMCDMENSADNVRIASYAPLFCNENDRKWPVNLINFNGCEVYGIPSYYVQKLFAENKVSMVVEASDTPDLYITAGIDESSSHLIIKVVHFSDEYVSCAFEIKGIKEQVCDMILLTSMFPSDTNSAADIKNVCDVRLDKEIKADGFSHTFAPYSFVVFKIKLV